MFKSLHKNKSNQSLNNLYDFLLHSKNADGQIWKTLTENQKKEIQLSHEESNEDKNLISWDAIKNRYFN